MKLSKQHIASLDVDAQYCFTPVCPSELPVPDGDNIVDELNAQALFAGYRVGSKDAHSSDAIWVADENNPPLTPVQGPNVDVRWPIHAVPGTKGFSLISGLPAVTEYDYFIWKGVEPDLHPYGCCYHDLTEKLSTGLIEFLQQQQVKLVIVGGLATDLCVKSTVLQLLAAKFNVIVNLGACRGVTPETTAQAIKAMQQEGAIMVKSTAELPSILEYKLL